MASDSAPTVSDEFLELMFVDEDIVWATFRFFPSAVVGAGQMCHKAWR